MWTVGRLQAIFHILDIFVYHRPNLDIKPTKKIGWRVLHHMKPPAKYERNLGRNVDCRSLTRNLCGCGHGSGRWWIHSIPASRQGYNYWWNTSRFLPSQLILGQVTGGRVSGNIQPILLKSDIPVTKHESHSFTCLIHGAEGKTDLSVKCF